MSPHTKPLDARPETLDQLRLFVRDKSWHVALKHGSTREYCYLTHPGEEHYHRLADGEIHLVRGDEKVCLPCAGRLGLLATDARHLGEPMIPVSLNDQAPAEPGYDLDPPRG